MLLVNTPDLLIIMQRNVGVGRTSTEITNQA